MLIRAHCPSMLQVGSFSLRLQLVICLLFEVVSHLCRHLLLDTVVLLKKLTIDLVIPLLSELV